MAGFAELGLSSWLVEQCRQLGLKQPTPVQLGCIPAILEGELWPGLFPRRRLRSCCRLLSLCPCWSGEARAASGASGSLVPEADVAVLLPTHCESAHK